MVKEKWLNMIIAGMAVLLIVALAATFAYMANGSDEQIIAVTGQQDDLFILLGSRVHGKVGPGAQTNLDTPSTLPK